MFNIMDKTPVTITISSLKGDASLPWPVLTEKYGLSMAQLKRAFRSAGINKKRATSSDKFVLVDDRPMGQILSDAGRSTFDEITSPQCEG